MGMDLPLICVRRREEFCYRMCNVIVDLRQKGFIEGVFHHE